MGIYTIIFEFLVLALLGYIYYRYQKSKIIKNATIDLIKMLDDYNQLTHNVHKNQIEQLLSSNKLLKLKDYLQDQCQSHDQEAQKLKQLIITHLVDIIGAM
ncbi:MAG: hypothetical protein N4A33_03605 [Bacteriovoracaceae bacterium]|jgi:signal transduction histidine kinase|nr:hypothetical protein [Bacteriovoracaceae bacterium]